METKVEAYINANYLVYTNSKFHGMYRSRIIEIIDRLFKTIYSFVITR